MVSSMSNGNGSLLVAADHIKNGENAMATEVSVSLHIGT